MKVWIDKFRMRRLSFTFAILATLSAGILLGSVMAHGVDGKETKVDSSDAKPLQIPNPVNLSTTFTQIAKAVGPAVVNINTISIPKSALTQRFHGNMQNPNGGQDGNGPDAQGPDGQGQGQGQGPDQGQGPGSGQGSMQDFFNHFFGFGGPQGPQGEAPDGGEREALGSGFIVDSRGYIITNNHVIDKADKIYVKLTTDPEGDQGHVATLVGTDKSTDIAVLKITVDHPLPTVKLGNSEGTQIGDWVLAVGSPFGLNQTVTAGIISSENRSIEPGIAGEFQHFIQTDAAINPGNSGGPLVNMDGQVIGVNTAIFTQSAGNEGIGFAMPANTVINVYNQLIGPEHKVVRGSIGIMFQTSESLSSAVGRVYGFKNGVLVTYVQPGWSAANAGIKAGDIVTSIDGREVKDGNDLITDIASRKPGSKITLGYIRSGKHETATVTVADRTAMMAALNNSGRPGSSNGPQQSGQGKLGLGVTNVPPEMASKANIQGGVLVRSIRPGSFADGLRLAPGMVIVQVNRQPVANVNQFQDLASKLKSGDDVVFLVVDPQHPELGNSYVGGTLP